jgi:hypothetical protein
MIKVKMLARHTGPTGKMEQGFEYLLSPDYAMELVKHGLAVLVLPENVPVEVIIPPVQFSRPKGQFRPQGKK